MQAIKARKKNLKRSVKHTKCWAILKKEKNTMRWAPTGNITISNTVKEARSNTIMEEAHREQRNIHSLQLKIFLEEKAVFQIFLKPFLGEVQEGKRGLLREMTSMPKQ